MTAFHVLGSLTALWAVLVSFLGIKREDFPSAGAEKLVALISTLLVLGTIGAAIFSGEEEEGEHGEEEAALVIR